MAANSQNVVVRVLSDFNDSGIGKASRSITKFTAIATAASGAVAVAGGAIGALGVGLAGVGALATPALAAVMLGMDGIKEAAGAARAPLDDLKAAMSSEFATGMVPGFEKLGGVLTAITPQMRGVAQSVSGVFNGLAGTIADNVGGLQQLADGGAKFVTALGPGLNQMVGSFISFGAQASASAEVVGASFGGLLGKIGQAFADLPVADIMTTFAGALDGLGNLIAPLINLVGQLAVALGPSLGGIFTALGGVVSTLTPHLTEMAAVLGPSLQQTITALGPAFGALGGSMATIVGAVGPLLPVVAGLVSSLATGLGPALPVIVGAVVAFNVALKVAKVATVAWAAVTKTIQIATKAWAAVQWVLNAALAANPIVLIVLAVAALVAIIIVIATKTTWFQTIWKTMCDVVLAVWNVIWGAIKTVATTYIDAVKAYIEIVMAVITAIWQALQAAVMAVWNAIAAAVSLYIGMVKMYIETAIAVITGIWHALQAAVSAVWDAISAVVSTVIGVISSVIQTGIDNVTTIFQTFQSVGETVFNTIGTAIGVVSDAISTVVGWVNNLIGALGNISWPEPPGWMKSVGGFLGFDAAPVGLSAYMVPQSHFDSRLMLASGYPSLSDLGKMSGGGRSGDTIIDRRVNITVNGAIDPIATRDQIAGLLQRADRIDGGGVAINARY